MTKPRNRTSPLMNRFALTTALSGIMVLGYGRSVYAGSCYGALGVYNCVGAPDAATDTTATINLGAPITVTTSSGFGIDTSLSGGAGIFVYGVGDVVFDGAASGLGVTGATDGLSVYNSGSGNLTIGTTGGSVTGLAATGVMGRTQGGAGTLDITTADVTGAVHGISALHFGSGSLNIQTPAGSVVGANDGISVNAGTYSSGLTVTTADVTGGANGLEIDNSGAGNTVVDTTAGSVTGTSHDGIAVDLSAATTGLTLTTADVAGGRNGLNVDTSGSGDITIDTTQGDVEGDGRAGVDVSVGSVAANDGSVTTGNVAGGQSGVLVSGANSGDLVVDTSAGVVTTGTVPSRGYNGAGVRVYGATTGTVSVTTGDVSGRFLGVSAANYGGGAIVIDTSAGNVTTNASGRYGYGYYGPFGSGIGVMAGSLYGLGYSYRGASDISVTTGDVSSGAGILAINTGVAGNTVVDTTAGTVTGDYLFGIGAVSSGGNLSITTADVSGARGGLFLGHTGTGQTDVDTTAGSISSYQGAGIGGYSNDGDVTIATADVTGGLAGIDFDQNQTGDLTVDSSAGTVTAVGSGADGINAGNAATSGHMTITTGDVTASGDGIEANHRGEGDLTIDTSAGSVVGGSRYFDMGIDASSNAGRNIAITTADVTSGAQGIAVLQAGTGTTTIDSSAGSILSTNLIGTGISVRSDDAAGDVNVTTADVSAGGTTINIAQYGAGDVNIDTTAGTLTTVSGYRTGVYVRNHYYGGDVTITTADVLGAYSGISAHNQSVTGGTSVDSSAGSVIATGTYGRGVAASTQAGDLSITTGDVAASLTGVDAATFGLGSETLTVDTTAGAVTASGASSTGVSAYASSGEAGDLTIRTANVSGGTYGISIRHGNAGAVVLDTTAGAVSGASRAGIQLNTVGETVTVSTGDVASDRAGIVAFSSGQGSTSVDTTAGTVTAGYGGAILVRNSTASTDVSVTTADASGHFDAVSVSNSGTGTTVIDSTAGTLTSATSNGVNVRTNLYSGDISIMTADIVAGRIGISAYSPGDTASISIDSSAGSITATATNYSRGISANLSGGDLSIVTADVESTGTVISARGSDTGSVSINTTAGSILNTGVRSEAISATGSGTDMSIVTADVTGTQTGINASQRGEGILTIDTTAGVVAGTSASGIFARHYGSDLSVTTGDVVGAYSGIYVRGNGTGAIEVDSTAGIVSSTAPYGRGLVVFGRENGTDITVRSGDVTSGRVAVLVGNTGTGATVVDTTEGTIDATGRSGFGISGSNGADTSSLTITSADVNAISTAIYGTNSGAGAMTVDTTAGVIESEESYGIRLRGSAGDIAVTTGDVSSYLSALSIRNTGAGTVDVDTTAGTVSAMGTNRGSGVYVSNSGDDVTVSTSDVTATGTGVLVRSFYAGDVAIDTTAGSVSSTGQSTSGVSASADFGDISIATGDVTANGIGLLVFGGQQGIAQIDTTGGTISSGAGRGLNVQSNGADIEITTADVSSAGLGVFAYQSGSGALSIDTTAGTVSSGDHGIYASTSSSGAGITIAASDISATRSAISVRSEAANGVTIASSGTLETTGFYSAVNVVQFGTGGVEIVNDGTIAGRSGLSTSQAVSAFSIADGEGVNLTNNGTITGMVSLGSADDTFTNNGTWDASGSASNFGDGFDTFLNTSDLTFVAGNGSANQVTLLHGLEMMENSGRITMIDGLASDHLIIAGDFDGTGGSLGLDMVIDGYATSSDVVSIYGDVIGDVTTIDLNLMDNGNPISAGSSVILIYNEHGEAGDFALADGPIQDDIFTYDLAYSTTGDVVLGSLYLESVAAYDAYPTALLNLGEMDRYSERLQGRQAFVAGADEPVIWVRADKFSYSDTSVGAGTGSSVSQLSNSFAAGADVGLGRYFGGDMFGGVVLQHVDSNTSYQSISGADTFGTQGMGLGATLTWVADDGHFFDFQAQNLWTETVLPTQSDANAGQVFSKSLEFGRNLVLADGWTATTSLQFSRTSINFDDVAGAFGETMSLQNGVRTTHKVGTTVTREWTLSGGAQASAFGSAHFSTFQSTGEIEVTADDATRFDREFDGSAIELGIGGAVVWDDGAKRLYGSISETDTQGDGARATTTKAALGFEFTW